MQDNFLLVKIVQERKRNDKLIFSDIQVETIHSA